MVKQRSWVSSNIDLIQVSIECQVRLDGINVGVHDRRVPKKTMNGSRPLEYPPESARSNCARPRSGQGEAPCAAAVRGDVHRQLHRPGQHRLRAQSHGNRSRHWCRRLWPRCRAILHRLRNLRSPLQPAAATLRRPRLADAHHVHLGRSGHGHGVRARRNQFLCAALHPRCGRSGVLPRHHLLLHPMVAVDRTR
ncbi:hypothetical protein D3C84_652550 [compost metagenome]